MTHLSVVLVVRHLIAHRRQVDVIVVIEGMACVTLRFLMRQSVAAKELLQKWFGTVWQTKATLSPVLGWLSADP